MSKTVYVNCPFCEGLMEIEAETGKLIQKWAPGEKVSPNQDKMASALQKIQDDKKKRATLFDQTKETLEGQKKKLEKSFEQEVNRIKKEGIKEKPSNPFDLD